MTVGLHHIDASLHERTAPFLSAGERPTRVPLPGAVTLHIGLADKQQPVFVAQAIPVRVVRIVTSPYRIEPIFFYESDIALHLLMRDRIAAAGGHLVPVDPPDNEPLAIHVDNRI